MTLLQNTLYGGASAGGAANCGVTFSINTDGSAYTILHSFTGKDGCFPTGSLPHVPNGGFVGITYQGGPRYSPPVFGNGVLFYISRKGTLYRLHNFGASGDGRNPNSVLVDGAGTVFGSTFDGGATCANTRGGCGTIFSYNLNTRQYSILYSFTNPQQGDGPILGSIGSDGTLYGTTKYGRGFATNGTLFALTPSSAGYTLDTLVYATVSQAGSTSGPTLTPAAC